MEEPIHFPCGERELFGILHRPKQDRGGAVLMVNGGPQARIGAHRSYVQVARYLCGLGLTVLRFDYAGLGDGQGDFVGYNKAAPSIRAALDFLFSQLPGLRQAYVWSLCDGAAASAVYARFDDRIAGMVLCNPYVFSDQVRSQTYIKHYYLQRAMEREFWAKLLSFKFNPLQAAVSFAQLFAKAFLGKRRAAAPGGNASQADGFFRKEDVKEEVLSGIGRFGKRVHFLLSLDDLTAMGFKDLLLGGETGALVKQGRLTYSEIRDADHTFSTPGSKRQVCELTRAALSELMATTLTHDGRSS